MRERISRLARGIVDTDIPKLQMSVSSFRGSYAPGERHQFNTVLRSSNEVPLKGLIYSTNPRVRPEKDAFGGLRSRLGCECSTEGLRDGDTIEGMLIIVSNAGEWQLPYLFLIKGNTEERPETAAEESGEYPRMLSEEPEEENDSRFREYLRELEGASETLHLYEHLVEAMPYHYAEPLPREVYLYFDYEQALRESLALPLYCNILRAFPAESDIYQRFERRIREFSVEALLHGRIDERYALLYTRMLFPDMVDRRMARVLPRLLHSYRISVRAEGLRAVVLRYPELREPRRFPLKDGTACVPLLFPDAEIRFEDCDGKLWDIPHRRERLLELPEIAACLAAFPEEAGEYRLAPVRRIVQSGIQKLGQLRLCEALFSEAEISDAFRRELAEAVLRYHARMKHSDRELLSEQDRVFLRELPPSLLGREEYAELLRSLIRLQELERAAALYGERQPLHLERDLLEQLLSFRIARLCEDGGAEEQSGKRAGREAVYGLCLATYQAFREGSRRRELLLFLLEHYNSSSWLMYELLTKSAERLCALRGGCALSALPAEERDAVNRLSERLLAQMLFSGMEEGLDEVHRLYQESGGGEPLLEKAFLTKKAALYFLRERETERSFFTLLYGLIHRENIKERLPLIYLLAMSKYMSAQERLSDEEKLELQEMMNVLTEKRLIFAYTERLGRFIPLPASVTNRSYIEYRSDTGEKPVLYVKILPDETDFREEELERVYQNIYVCPLLLFAGEQAVYKICRIGEEFPVQQGSVKSVPEPVSRTEGDSYALLNELSGLLEAGDCRELRDRMLQYTRKEAMIRVLFARGDGKL